MDIDALDKMGARGRLLFAGFQLFLQKGVDGTGIDEILKSAEVSRGGMYHHFSSKMALYEAVLEQYFLRGFAAFDRATFADLSFEAQKRVLCETLGDMFGDLEQRYEIDRARYFALLFDSLSRSQPFAKAIRKYYAELTQLMSENANDAEAATNFLRQVEGEIYLATVFGRVPDFSKIIGE